MSLVCSCFIVGNDIRGMLGEECFLGRPFLLVCVHCALVVCTHTHTKPLGGYPLGCVVWVLPCAIERVGVVAVVVCGVGAAVRY